MMERVAEASPRRWARIAGGLYLSVIVGGFFAVGGQIQELDGDGDQHEGYHQRSIAPVDPLSKRFPFAVTKSISHLSMDQSQRRPSPRLRGAAFSFEAASYFGCFFICFNLGSLVRMRRYKIMAFACPCPSRTSDLSHARSSECFATILPFFTNPFLLANARKSSGDLPVFAWMLSRYALNVTSPLSLLGSLMNYEKRFV